MYNPLRQFPHAKNERPTEFTKEALDELKALTGNNDEEELKTLAKELVAEIRNAPRTGRTLQNPVTREFAIALESSQQKERLINTLGQVGISPWEDDGLLIIDHRRDLRKLDLLGLRKTPVFESKPADEVVPNPPPPNPFTSGYREPFAEQIKRLVKGRAKEQLVKEEKKQGAEDDDEDGLPEGLDEGLRSILSRFQQGLLDDDEPEFIKTVGLFPALRLFPRQYVWKGKTLIEKRTGRVVTLEERMEFYAKAKEGDVEAMNRVVRIHTGLVLSVVVRMREKYRGDPDDFFQEGMIALMDTVRSFDSDKGKFSTHAVPRIEQAMSRFSNRYRDPITVPENARQSGKKLTKAHEKMRKAGSTEPADILEDFGESPIGVGAQEYPALRLDRIERLYLMHTIFEPIATEDEKTPEALTMPDLSDETAFAKEVRDQLTKAFTKLTAREERVIRMRFGFGTPSDYDDKEYRADVVEEGMSLEEVANRFGLSRDRVRQIESSGLRKLKHPSRSRALRALMAGFEEKK